MRVAKELREVISMGYRWRRYRRWPWGYGYGPGPWWAYEPLPEEKEAAEEGKEARRTHYKGYGPYPPAPAWWGPPWGYPPYFPPPAPPYPGTPEEELEMLEEYKRVLEEDLRDIQEELEGVNERIKELKKTLGRE